MVNSSKSNSIGGLILPYNDILPTIDETCFVAPTAMVQGDVVIGEGSSIWYHVVIRGDVNEIRIGKNTNIQDGTVIHVTSGGHGTYLGDNITVGHMVMLHACTVESGAFIGMKSCLLDGVVVESGAFVAAGAVVSPNTRIPSGELWGGIPAKRLRDVRETDKAFMLQNAVHYRRLAENHKQIISSTMAG